MNEKPYHNEPGLTHERCFGDSKRYNQCVVHETLRVAACNTVGGNALPLALQPLIEQSFLVYTEHYLAVIDRHKHLDGHEMDDPHRCNKGVFQFEKLRARISELSAKINEATDL